MSSGIEARDTLFVDYNVEPSYYKHLQMYEEYKYPYTHQRDAIQLCHVPGVVILNQCLQMR